MRDPNLAYLAVAFALAWTLIGAYLARLWVAQRRLERRLDDLERHGGGRTG